MKKSPPLFIVIGSEDTLSPLLSKVVKNLEHDFEFCFIEESIVKNALSNFTTLHAASASLARLLVSRFKCQNFRFLCNINFFDVSCGIRFHLLGLDKNIEFFGVFGEPGDVGSDSFKITDFPVCYFSERFGACSLIPEQWHVAKFFDLAEKEAVACFLDSKNRCAVYQAAESNYKALYAIQNGSRNKTPIICIPGAGDNITSFTDLASVVDSSTPVYGLQPRGLDGMLAPHTSVSHAATFYIDTLKEEFSHSAIHLIGHSFGGWVAYEIAARLSEHNITIESLTLIDSEVPDNEDRAYRDVCDLDVIRHYVDSIEMSINKPLSINLSNWENIDEEERLRRLHSALAQVGSVPPYSKHSFLAGPLNTFATAYRTTYVPAKTFSGRFRLVVAPDEKLSVAENKLAFSKNVDGWSDFCRNIHAVYGTGNHISILDRPHIDKVMDWWKERNGDLNREVIGKETFDCEISDERISEEHCVA